MTSHPYKELPDTCFWRRSVASMPPENIDPVIKFKLKIDPSHKVATAGSCFAQHIARHLRNSGFNYYIAENGHPLLSQDVRDQSHYGVFSARYGNVYTARQLLQLFDRAHGDFEPSEPVWRLPNGRVVDPFRPTIEPGGFINEGELLADRRQHLACVKRLFSELDVFVFTLGLTECWRSKADGAVFPICPGVEGGEFDPSRHEFYNQTTSDVIKDFRLFATKLREVNPKSEIVITVSPVPLAATARSGMHVLTATTYSKAVLRVAADSIRTKSIRGIHYFPSYEIVTSMATRGRYFAEDLRNVTEEGVSHVMRVFMKHATNSKQKPLSKPPALDETKSDSFLASMQHFVEVECDEIALDKPRSEPSSVPYVSSDADKVSTSIRIRKPRRRR